MIVAFAALCIATAVVLAAVLLAVKRRRAVLDRRLDEFCAANQETNNSLFQPLDASALPAATPLSMLITRLGLQRFSPGMIGIAFAILCVGVFAGVWLGWALGLVFCCSALFFQVSMVRWLRQRRAQALAEALPSFLERVRQFVLIGNTLQQAFIKAVDYADPTVKLTFEPMVRRINLGASFTDSMQLLARREHILELHMLHACIWANIRYGGRVAQNLSNLIKQLDNRLRLQREIQAATAETRTSAITLLALTVLVFVWVMTSNSDYLEFFLATDARKFTLMAIIAWPVVGLFVMRRVLKVHY